MTKDEMNPNIKKAITEIKAGNKKAGQALLMNVLRSDSGNERAWQWLSVTFDDLEKRKKALQKVLEINPYNETARKQLNKISESQTTLDVISTPPRMVENRNRYFGESSGIQRKKKQLLQQYIANMTSRGWEVVYATDEDVQLKRRRCWNRLLLIAGLVTIPFGFGLFILILAAVDYLIKSEKTIFVTADQLEIGRAPKVRGDWSTPTILGVVIVGAVLLLALFVITLGLIL